MGVGFRLSGRTLELTGPWSPTAGRAVRLLRPSGLDVNYTRGFDGDDLDFLGDLAGTTIRRLSVVDHELEDLSPLLRLAPQLEHLTVRTPSTQTLDLARFPRLVSYRGPWAHVRDTITWGTRVERLMLEGYAEPDLAALQELPSLTALRLDRPERLRRLRGVGPGLAAPVRAPRARPHRRRRRRGGHRAPAPRADRQPVHPRPGAHRRLHRAGGADPLGMRTDPVARVGARPAPAAPVRAARRDAGRGRRPHAADRPTRARRR